MKWYRNDYLSLMTFGEFPRPMFVELFGPLVGLAEEWREQGATEDEIDMIAFDWDYVEPVSAGGECCAMGGMKPHVISETDEYILERDYLGRTVKLCKGKATIGLPVDYPVKTADDWREYKHMYVPRPDRIDDRKVEAAKAAQAQGAVVHLDIGGGFDTPRQLMGEEVACLAYYEQPELMHEIMATLREATLQVIDGLIERGLTIDILSIHEDLAGKSGPLIGPNQIDEFVKPYFSAVWDRAQQAGASLCQMDTDGDFNAVIDAFRECGVNCFLPLEPAAGMDIVAVREKYPDLAMLGGIDKHVLRQSQADIRKELEYKLQPSMQSAGGMVFGLDHRIPNGTPLENYRYYVSLSREILGIEPLSTGRKGWSRMAF